MIKEESEKQKELAVKKWEKTDKPNPHTYNTDKADKVVSNKRRYLSFSFSKGKRNTYQGKSHLVRK